MNLQFDDMDIEIVEVKTRKRDFPGGTGWVWEDSRLPAVGPFKSVALALRDIVDQLESGKLAATLEAYYEMRRAKGYGPPPGD